MRTIEAHVVGAGGTFAGSAREGTFSLPTPIGVFEGIYRIEGRVIAIEVLEKPFFVPCGAIESQLLRFVKEAI
ncbi:MAG TPA: hypothetical protein VEK15_11775 [Vicinamibacteria bacterium]|nr:hypothetical protein [Vicinamibacteria bacterium]